MDNTDLNEGQQKAFDVMLTGENCYISGEAGTGKSYLVNKFIKESKSKGLKVVVCAPTGIAADNIGGVTIHRAFGYPATVLNANIDPKKVKIYDEEVTVDSHRFITNGVIEDANIIIVDEISSVRLDLFELLTSQILDVNNRRAAIEDKRGPVQLIVTGDFTQTKPVVVIKKAIKKDEPSKLKQIYPYYVDGYAFESKNWSKMNFKMFNLSEVIRTSDKDFSYVLRCLRFGDERALWWFNDNIHNKWDGESTVICGTRKEVDTINNECLNKLEGKTYIFNESSKMEPGYTLTDGDRRNSEVIKLKEGARVMCLVNDKDGRYVNGSRGYVTAVDGDKVRVAFDNRDNTVIIEPYTWQIKDGKDEIIGSVTQIPLVLAYAMTVHKVQGQTMDKACIKPSIYFDYAMHYVALGRVKTLEGLQFYGDEIFTKYVTYESGYKSNIKLASKNVINFLRDNNLI